MTLSAPRLQARLAGFLYLSVIALSLFAEAFVRDRLIVARDAAATAHNIMASQSLFRLGLAADVLSPICYIGVTAILYVLLKPVGRSVAMFGLCCGLAGSAVMAVNMANLFAVLNWLSPQTGLSREAGQALAYAALRLHGQGYNLSIVFFGCHLIALGWLVARSRFLPRLIGVLLAIAGICYDANSFAIFLGAGALPYALAPGLAGEGALALWLMLVGLNEAKWREQAGGAP